MKPVEGLVKATPILNKIPFLPRVARVAAVAAAAYFGIGLLKSGAQTAFGGGDTLLDRIGPGGGELFPPMDLPAAPYHQQPLPPVSPWGTA